MTYKRWPCIAKFNSSGTFVYFNKGENPKGEPMLGINVNGSKGYKSKITVFDNMKVDMIENLIVAVKETFGFDYIAYLQASGRFEPGEQEFDMMASQQQEWDEPAPPRTARAPISTETPDDDGKSCIVCGNPPGDNWAFWMGTSTCGQCGKVYREKAGI